VPSVDPIHVVGLRDFQAALKAMDGESQKQLRVVLNRAAEMVADDARRKVPTRTGAARKSVRVQSSQREAKVVAGSKKVAYYGWLDFGGKVGRSNSNVRRWVPRGRYLYPAYDANRDEILKALGDGLADLARDAGLDVT
jgi:hypothetical protein